MTKSISDEELVLNPNKRTAIIYSVDELIAYIVEINYKHESYLIKENDKAKLFGNLDEAKKAAMQYNVDAAFLALSKAYQEVDLSNDHSKHHTSRYDYISIKL